MTIKYVFNPFTGNMDVIDEAAAVNVGGLYGLNVEDITGAKDLVVGTDEIYQYLNPSGNGFDINMRTAAASVGDRFVIRNCEGYSSSNRLDIESEGTAIDKLYSGGIRKYIFDGVNWIPLDVGGSKDLSYFQLETNIQIGNNAKVTGNGVAIGTSADASNDGVAIGLNASANNRGVAVGQGSQGDNYSIGIGYNTETYSKRYSIALGYYARSYRVGETTIHIGGDLHQENNILLNGWVGTTTDDTPKEIYSAGYGTNKYTIRAKSALTYKIMVTARDNTTGDCAAYSFDGLIKRDAANNTTMSVCNKTVTHEDDATWDCNVTADDVNESLKIEVTGDDTNPTKWAARLDGVETHF